MVILLDTANEILKPLLLIPLSKLFLIIEIT